MKLKILRKWKERRAFRYIPPISSYEPFHEILKSFNEDIPYSSEKVKDVDVRPMYPLKKLEQDSGEQLYYILNKVRNLKYIPHYEDSYDALFKIVLFGDIVEGREELRHKFLPSLFKSNTKMTIGVDFEVINLKVDQNLVKLQIWDLDGKERFRSLYPTYVRGSTGGLFIYNVSHLESLDSIDDWLSLIKRKSKETYQFPILVVGLISEPKDIRTVSAEYAIKVVKARGLDGYIECNVKTGENFENSFKILTRLILQKT